MVVSDSISSANTLVLDEVVGVILSEEMRWESIGETSSSALSIDNMGRQRERGKNQGNRE